MKILRLAGLAIAATSLGASVSQAAQYEVDFRLNTAASYVALQYSADYSAASGDFDGSAAAVSCTPNAGLAALSSFNDKDSSSTLTSAFITTSGIAGPVVLCTCIFTAGSAPSAGNFSIAVETYDPGSSPSISVSRVALH